MYAFTLRHRLPILASIVLLAGGLVLSGCDFLEKSPKGELTSENFFETPEHAVQGTNATYNMLREWQVHVFAWLGMTEIASDDATKGSVPGDASFLLELDEKGFGPSNIAFESTWSGYYTGVYRANVAIQNIPSIDMEASRKEQLIGENKFLRAYYYFFLVRAYGGVPEITEPLQPSEFEQSRASREEIYSLIEADLTDAISALPPRSQYTDAEMGRATQGAAEGLLAKVHLFQEEYDEALEHAENVISSGEYSLLDDYWTIFREEGEYSSGSIFEVGAVAQETGAEGSSQYAQVQGVRGSANNGWGFNQPSPDLEQSYEPGDPRHQATILHPWEALPDGSGVIAEVNPNMPNQRYNEKVQPSVDAPGGSGNNTVNIRRLRYADVLLIAAEAAYQTGDEQTARTYLNDVRERAREDRSVTLGIQPENMAPQLAESVGLAGGDHVFVRYAAPNGPAAQAGIESFSFSEDPVLVTSMDVIESVDGTEVTSRQDLYDVLSGRSDGESVPVEITRVSQQEGSDGPQTTTQTLSVSVEVAALLPDVTAGGQALLDAIWAERRAELAMEQHRYFDLLRQGRAQEVLPNFQSRHTVYPIPQSEIDLSGEAMSQNDGY